MNARASAAAAAAAGALGAVALLALFGAFRRSGPDAWADATDEKILSAKRRASQAQKDGRAKEAEAFYRDLVAARPLDADAHLLLGIHLKDLAKDPFGAIGQFNDFLRLAPESEKADKARESIRECELAIAGRFHAADAAAGGAAVPAPAAADEARLRRLAGELDEARAAADALRAETAELRAERDRLKRDNAAKQNQIDALKGSGSTAKAPTDDLTRRFDKLSAGAGSSSPAPQTPAQTIRIADYMTYEVRRGDTLWKIAQDAYHDGSRTAEIKAANPGLVGADGSVREGTILRIPR